MAIWFDPDAAKNLITANKQLYPKTMLEHLDIQLIELGDDYLKGSMPVDDRTKQPAGIMHGGASCVLAESLGSIAGYLCVDPSKYQTVGLDIYTTHIRSVSSGVVIGTAKPVHLGRSTQVWEIQIESEERKLVSINRLTIFVKQNT